MLHFLFRIVFKSFFLIPLHKIKTKLKLVLAIHTGASKEAINTQPLVVDKTIRVLPI